MRQIIFLFIPILLLGCFKKNPNSNTKTRSTSLSADTILERQFRAMGGKDKLGKIKFIREIIRGKADNQEFYSHIICELGRRAIKQYIKAGWETLYFSQQGSGFYARHLFGENSYEIREYGVEHSPNSEKLRGDTYYSSFGLLLNYKENNVQIQHLDTVMDSKSAYPLLVTYPDGRKILLFIDTTSYMVNKARNYRPDGVMENESLFYDFELNSDGIIFPKHQAYSSTDKYGNADGRYYGSIEHFECSDTVPRNFFIIDTPIVHQYYNSPGEKQFQIDLFENDLKLRLWK